MYVKVYTYHVHPRKVTEYKSIQQRADQIYSDYVEKTTLYLNSNEDPTKWMEVHQYENEETYREAIERVNARSEIDELYEAFLNVLVDRSVVIEEDYRRENV